MRITEGPMLAWHLAWAPLLLLICRVVHGDYFISNPQCGFPTAAQDFVGFNQAPQLTGSAVSVGVCNWGITNYTYTRADDFAGKCLSCTLVPFTEEGLCPAGYRINEDEIWQLARVSDCTWTGCLDMACPAGYMEGQTAACGTKGGIARLCCPVRPHVLCCQALQCTRTNTPSGCVVDNKALNPGQVASTLVYAVPQASQGQCSAYSFSVQRTCLANHTLSGGHYYDNCQTSTPSTDDSGCPMLPGYTRVAHQTYQNPGEALLDDSTQWSKLPTSSSNGAAFDPVVMAGRCSQTADCAGFDLTGALTLRAYVPSAKRWRSNSDAGTDAVCAGTYVKQLTQSSCSRIRGYLFSPGVSWVNSTGSFSSQVCSSCGVSETLANACNSDMTCGAFSNMHGLLVGLTTAAAAQTLQNVDQFTVTPCKGLFTKVGSQTPTEVELLDRLLCGDSNYCQPALKYSWTKLGQWVDITVTLTSDLDVPSWLLFPNDATLAVLPQIPALRRLQIVCQPGMQLKGGLPRRLFSLMPALQQWITPGCGLGGFLASDLPSLAPPTLHVLDLSANDIEGMLPPTWGGAWEMSMLNLSSNRLSGGVPSGWVSVPRAASSLNWGSSGEPQESGVALNVVDLSYNNLEGPVPRSIITETCLYGSMRLEFDVAASTSGGIASYRTAGQAPLLVLYGNVLLRTWTDNYLLASSQRLYSREESKENLCGSYQYIVAICVMWGTFTLIMLGILTWWLVRRRIQAARCTVKHQELKQISSSAQPDNLHDVASDTTPNPVFASPASTPALASDGAVSGPGWFDSHWNVLWVRQVVFLLRLLVLGSDMALDVAVVMWLWRDGEVREAAVCVAFISLAQFVAALGVFTNLFLPTFSSACALVLGGLPVLAATPVIAPVLAVWNIFNPSVPLVSWRFLELQEFAVMLFQAPAQSVTKTIIYAQQSRLGGGMYINHGLFIASIALSLIDIAISVFKLARYKNGAWQRICNAFSHLDKSRDVGSYQPLDGGSGSWYERDHPTSRYSGSSPDAEAYRLAFISARKQQSTTLWDAGGVSMRNPLLGIEDAGGPRSPFGSPIDAQSRVQTAGGSRASPTTSFPSGQQDGLDSEIQPGSPQRQSGNGGGNSGLLLRISRTSNTSYASAQSNSSAWSMHLPPPPTQSSLLQQSSLRLAMNTAMEAITASLPVAHVVPRPASAGATRRSGSGEPIPLLQRTSQRAKSATPRQPSSPTQSLRVSASGPSIGRSPLGKRHSNVSESDMPQSTHAGGLFPSHASPFLRSSTSGTPRDALGSPRVSSGYNTAGASEVVLGLFRRVNSQEAASSSYYSATSSCAGVSAVGMPKDGSPMVSHRNSHAGPSGQLHVSVGKENSEEKLSTSPHAWSDSHSGNLPKQPSPIKLISAVRSPSPVAGSGPSGTAVHSGSAVSLEGLFSTPSLPLGPSQRPPLPPRPGTPRARGGAVAASGQPASPRSAFATPQAQTGPHTAPSGPSSSDMQRGAAVPLGREAGGSGSSSSSSSSNGGHGTSSARFHPMPDDR